MGNTDKARARAYRRRMIERGYKQMAFWLDKDAQVALKLLKQDSDLSTVVCEALRHYHTYRLSKGVTSNVTSNTKGVTSNVTNNVTNNVTSNRYMPQALEDYILELRQEGMRLNEVAQRLSSEGYRNAKGEAYSTGTLSKAESRAKARRQA